VALGAVFGGLYDDAGVAAEFGGVSDWKTDAVKAIPIIDYKKP
jgi:hypothetical protein